eukprot:1177857-Prorocentrum_minimum.AAC.2
MFEGNSGVVARRDVAAWQRPNRWRLESTVCMREHSVHAHIVTPPILSPCPYSHPFSCHRVTLTPPLRFPCVAPTHPRKVPLRIVTLFPYDGGVMTLRACALYHIRARRRAPASYHPSGAPIIPAGVQTVYMQNAQGELTPVQIQAPPGGIPGAPVVRTRARPPSRPVLATRRSRNRPAFRQRVRAADCAYVRRNGYVRCGASTGKPPCHQSATPLPTRFVN